MLREFPLPKNKALPTPWPYENWEKLMEALKRFFSIQKWTYKELLVFLAAFLIFNLFAPRGFVQWILIQQDIRRVRSEKGETLSRLNDLEEDIRIFQRSDLIKEQKLRE